MRFKSNYLIPFFFLFLLSCSDFIEEDITSEELSILTPIDNLTSGNFQQLFWWEENSQISRFQLQIVKPSFDSISELVLDTIISGNKFNFDLTPGIYSWRIKGMNDYYSTYWVSRRLTIIDTINISSQFINLKLPISNDTSNSSFKLFSWQLIPHADKYEFQLSHEGNILCDTILISNSLERIVNSQGTYIWKVRAQNDLYNTLWSYREFYIDTEPVPPATLLFPNQNDVLTDSLVNFLWSHDINIGSRIWDSLLISSEPDFENVNYQIVSHNSQTTCNISPGVWYWKVTSYDKAGNKTIGQDFSKFSIIINGTK